MTIRIPIPTPTGYQRFITLVMAAAFVSWWLFGPTPFVLVEVGFAIGSSLAGAIHSRWFLARIEGLRDNVNEMTAAASSTQRELLDRIEALQETVDEMSREGRAP